MNDWELNRRVYAGDFGAGNTCLFAINPDAPAIDPTPFNDENAEPSGYGLRKNGKIELGRELMGLRYQDLKDVDRFHINLKAIPSAETRDELVFYFRGWLNKIKSQYKQEFDGVEKEYWFIGCPTVDEWKAPEIRDIYRRIFEEAGFQNVFIYPESDAALAYYEKTKNVLQNLRMGEKILLIDQGAYSLDGTYYPEGASDIPPSYGSCLGAGLIERMMTHTILYENEESVRLGRRIINMPEVVAAARRLYEHEPNGKFVTYLLLQTRRLKEMYFNTEKEGTLLPDMDLTLRTDFPESINEFPELTLPEKEYLFLFTNEKMMHQILNEKPVCVVLADEFFKLPKEVQDELGNQTWMQAFNSYLERLDSNYGGLSEGEHLQILLTGGGSRMKCVSEAVQKRFKKAIFYGDATTSIFAIGKGLAYWSRDKVHAMDFKAAFQAFLERTEIDEDDDKVNVVTTSLVKAFGECVAEMCDEVVNEEVDAVKAGIEAWREYNCTSSNIPGKMQQHFNDWCTQTGIPHFTANIKKKIENLKKQLNKDFIPCVLDPLHLQDGIKDELLTQDDEVFLSMSRLAMKSMFDAMMETIISHYRGHPIWNQFPNDKKRFFSDPRQEWLNVNAEALGEWVGKEVGATRDMAFNIFCEHEFELTDSFTGSFLQLFVSEAYYDLENLMRERVKKMMGTLVLEEHIDE